MSLGFDCWVLGSADLPSFPFHKIRLMFAAYFLLRKDWGTKGLLLSWAFSLFLSFQDDAIPLKTWWVSCVPTCNPLSIR